MRGILTTSQALVNRGSPDYSKAELCEFLIHAVRDVAMPSDKERIANFLQDQPDDKSYEEILRELIFMRMVEKGLADSDAGRAISHEGLGHRIRMWRNASEHDSPS